MKKIYVEAPDVWEHFQSHLVAAMDGLVCLAENDEFGVTIYMMEDSGLPLISVEVDGDVIIEEQIESEAECETDVAEIYDMYLTSSVINILIDGDGEEPIIEELDDIEVRELELDDAIYALVDTFVPNLSEITDDIDVVYEDLKDHICEYLYQEHDISVYRPMILEDEDGSDYYTEFPYPEMELDDN